jgi:uncharacterized protein
MKSEGRSDSSFIFHPSSILAGLDRRFVWFLAGLYAVWVLRVVVLLSIEYQLDSALLRQCSSHVLKIIFWVVAASAYIRFVDKENPVSFLKLNVLPRAKPFLLGEGITVAFLIIAAVVALTVQGGSLQKLKTMTAVSWFALSWGMALVAITEEILFRGFIFQKLRAVQSFHKANITTSILFLVIHWPGWLYMQGPHWGLLQLSGSILLISWVLGLLFEVTHSLWPPILLHFLNNVLSGALSN